MNEVSELYKAEDEVPIAVETLTKLYTEQTYFGTHGAPGCYEVCFVMMKHFVWNDEDEEEKKIIAELHKEYIMKFKE